MNEELDYVEETAPNIGELVSMCQEYLAAQQNTISSTEMTEHRQLFSLVLLSRTVH